MTGCHGVVLGSAEAVDLLTWAGSIIPELGYCQIDAADTGVKSGNCRIDQAAARLKSGNCRFDQAATEVKPGNRRIGQAAAKVHSGRGCCDQDFGLWKVSWVKGLCTLITKVPIK